MYSEVLAKEQRDEQENKSEESTNSGFLSNLCDLSKRFKPPGVWFPDL